MAGSFGNGRNSGGISGPSGKNVAPIYKPTGGTMGPAKIQGPKLPEKKKPSVISKIKNILDEKPKYSPDVIVWNKKMDAQAAKNKNK